MNNFLNWVEIKNFKSIKDLRLDCKRVNVFIGKPNVGKSNILEGLGLLGAEYSVDRFMDGFARYKELKHLFHDNDIKKAINVVSDKIEAELLTDDENLPSGVKFIYNQKAHTNTLSGTTVSGPVFSCRIDKEGKIQYADEFAKSEGCLKKYDYANLIEFDKLFQDYLLPPDGLNLYSVIRYNKDLWAEFAKLFTEQKLELVLYDEKQEFILQKKDGPYVWQYPYFSIADTFRRFMFYITAIESNKNSVIIFEEPEVHSFPPYVKAMAHRIVSSDENQFFVSTHSPYLLQTLISDVDDSELAVYITYYKDYETQVRQLSPDELQEAQDLSIDLFYNLSRYEPNA